ncbi:MAG: hypothetical protein ABH950_02655, partial [Candidatus Altiarchaeota archaeon]
EKKQTLAGKEDLVVILITLIIAAFLFSQLSAPPEIKDAKSGFEQPGIEPVSWMAKDDGSIVVVVKNSAPEALILKKAQATVVAPSPSDCAGKTLDSYMLHGTILKVVFQECDILTETSEESFSAKLTFQSIQGNTNNRITHEGTIAGAISKKPLIPQDSALDIFHDNTILILLAVWALFLVLNWARKQKHPDKEEDEEEKKEEVMENLVDSIQKEKKRKIDS